MADCFDVVSIRVDDEGCIVLAGVVGSQARGTIVFAAGFQGSAVKGVCLLSTIGTEAICKCAGFSSVLNMHSEKLPPGRPSSTR